MSLGGTSTTIPIERPTASWPPTAAHGHPLTLVVGVLGSKKLERAAIAATLRSGGLKNSIEINEPSAACQVIVVRECPLLRTRAIIAFMQGLNHDQTRILALCDSHEQMAEAICSGADAVLPMSTSASHVFAAISQIMSGSASMPAEVLTLVVETDRIHLDPLQAAVLSALADGVSDDAIGIRCRLTPSLIRDILGDLRRIFGMQNRAQIVAAAFRAGLLSTAFNRGPHDDDDNDYPAAP